MARPSPSPEVVRRALERMRGGEAVAVVAREASVTESTLRRWKRLAEEAPAPPPIMRAPPPAPPDSPADLAAELEHVAVALDGAGGADLARVVRRAADALRAPRPELDDIALPDAGTDTRAYVVAMIARTQRQLAVQEATHNSRAVAQLTSALERWTRLLKQVDSLGTGDDVITIPRSELAQRVDALRGKLAALSANGPLCASCGKRVRAEWGASCAVETPP